MLSCEYLVLGRVTISLVQLTTQWVSLTVIFNKFYQKNVLCTVILVRVAYPLYIDNYN